MAASFEFLWLTAEQLSGQTSALGLAFLVLVWVLIKQFKRDPKLPPGPKPLPIIGNIHQLGKLPHRSFYELSKIHGPVMYLRLGFLPCVVVSNSEMAKEILRTHDLTFANRPATAAGKHVAYNNKNIGLASYGPYWRLMRKLCVHVLLSAKRFESFRPVRQEEVSLAMKSMWERSKEGTVRVNISTSLLDITSAIIWRMLTGTRFDVDDVTGRGGELKLMVREIIGTLSAVNIGDFFPSIDWMDLQGLKKRMVNAHNFFDKIVGRIIDDHIEQNKMALEEKKDSAKDVLDVLLDVKDSRSLEIDFDNDNIKAVLFDLFIGGMETTATTMEWAITALLKHPHCAKKLQAEIDSVVGKDRMVSECDLPKMHYLQCVMKESLRLHMPGPLLLPHQNNEAVSIGPQGYVIPAKTKVFVNAWAISRDPNVWEDPHDFKPERFEGNKSFDYQGQEFDMIPFGIGRRGCPGIHMAIGQFSFVLATFWHCFDWRLEGNPTDLDMEEEFGATVSRKNHLYAIPSVRLSTSL